MSSSSPDFDRDLGLGRMERWMLRQVRQRGVGRVVVVVTSVVVCASAVIVVGVMGAVVGFGDRAMPAAFVLGVAVPGLLAPPALILTMRLAAGLDRVADLLWTASRTDPLTGVANRRSFYETLERRQSDPEAAADLAVVDIDSFKELNDRHGHHMGDLALRRVADWLQELAAPDGFVARLGGDEFALLSYNHTDASRPTTHGFEQDGVGEPNRSCRDTLGGMCRATVCSKCSRPSWAGCGAHVEQVLGHVPPEQRCQCQRRGLMARLRRG